MLCKLTDKQRQVILQQVANILLCLAPSGTELQMSCDAASLGGPQSSGHRPPPWEVSRPSNSRYICHASLSPCLCLAVKCAHIL